jgi:hypothetical protein
MLNNSLLNPQNYTHVGSYPVHRDKDLILPQRAELFDTMLIRWTISHLSKDTNFDNLGSGLLISEIEIQGFGVIESQTFDIPPSNFQTKRVQLINLDLEVPQKLTFRSQSSGVLNSVLEFYAYTGQDERVYNTFHTDYMPSNNPSSINPADLTAAFTAAVPAMAQQIGAATQVATTAALAAEKAAETARNSIDRDVTIKAWTGNAGDHLVIQPSQNRIETKIFNRHNQRMYISIGTPSTPGQPVVAKTFESYTEILEPNGSFISTDDDRLLPIYIYLAANKPSGQASITELTP